MIVLGLDAGGTKTVCQLADADGRVLNEVRGPGANLISLGPQGVEAVLGDMIARALDQRADRVDAVCLGMAGADHAREADAVREVLARIGLHGPTVVVNDALIALEAGAPGSAGVVVITGTGSIAYGRDAHGRAARAGGWGYVLADEGSGYWLGREALVAVLRAADQRGPATALTGFVLMHYGVTRPQDVGREVYRGGVKPSAIAELVRYVHAAAESGDAVATGILDRAASELALLGWSVSHRLDLPEGPIVLAGGTPRAATGMFGAFTRALAGRLPRATARLLDVEPAHGAVRLALALARGELRVPQYVE